MSDVGVEQRNLGRRRQRFFLLVRQLLADVGNDHVPASQDAMRGLHRVHFAAARVCDFHFLGAGGISLMLHSHRRAVQADAHRRVLLIKPGIVGSRHDHVGGGVARNCLRNQLAHQQARDGSVAIGKMEKVFLGFFVGDGIAVHAFARTQDRDSCRRSPALPCPMRPARTPRQIQRRTRVAAWPETVSPLRD